MRLLIFSLIHFQARLLKEKEIAQAEHDVDKLADINEKLSNLEHRAEELDKKRTENTKISAISLINNRNRRNNVLKAEQAIQEEIRRKEIEGNEDNPFTRRKCNPRMVTKSQLGVNKDDLLKQLEQQNEKENREKQEKLKKQEEEKQAALKRKREQEESNLDNKKNKKEDLFDAHDFDIEIDVDTSLTSSSMTSASAPPAAAVPPIANPVSKTVGSGSGPSKRSLNLSDYKKKRGLI